MRGYALRAVQARGALTESGIAEHCRFPGGIKAMRPVVDALVARGTRPAGRGRRRRRAGRRAGRCAARRRARRAASSSARSTTCSGTAPFVERVFGFRHVIEVYKPAPQREYGYYVLPFLYGDRLVGRADLKSDRGRGRPARARVPPRAEGAPLGRARGRVRQGPRPARPRARPRYVVAAVIEVSREEARRIAVRAQLLDGSARGVLDTVRRLGFLQIDPISTVGAAPAPRPLERGSARGTTAPSSTACSGRSGSSSRSDAFIYPIEDLPLLLARMRRRREHNARERADRRVPEGERRVPALRPPRARAARAAALARDRGPRRARSASRTAGGASGRWR